MEHKTAISIQLAYVNWIFIRFRASVFAKRAEPVNVNANRCKNKWRARARTTASFKPAFRVLRPAERELLEARDSWSASFCDNRRLYRRLNDLKSVRFLAKPKQGWWRKSQPYCWYLI